tara:strand:- start:40169 stop:40618 length:450 start_codon:yes stop_codon:yes gene_type:complete
MNFLVKHTKKLFLAFLIIGTSAIAQEKVSDTELNQFANAINSIQLINQEAQSTMLEVVEQSGFDLEKFNATYEAAMNNDTETMSQLSEEETKKFESIMARFEAMQAVFQKQMEDAVAKQQISMDRFNEISVMLENDFELQTRLQALMEN